MFLLSSMRTRVMNEVTQGGNIMLTANELMATVNLYMKIKNDLHHFGFINDEQLNARMHLSGISEQGKLETEVFRYGLPDQLSNLNETDFGVVVSVLLDLITPDLHILCNANGELSNFKGISAKMAENKELIVIAKL